MAWQTPKTNWGQAGQTVPGAGDFNRIEGNIQHLQDTKETPAGAQAKADAAESAAKSYADVVAAGEAGAVRSELDAHLSDYAQHGVTMGRENDLYVAKIRSLFRFTALEANYGGTIWAIATDDEFVYVGGGTTQTVRKLRKSNLSQVAESASYGGIIYAIVVDDEFVYVGGGTQTLGVIENRDLIKIIRRY